MKKVLKKAIPVLLVLIMCLSMSVCALAVEGEQYASPRSSTFSFWIENFGDSAYNDTSAYKSSYSDAYVDCDSNTVFWPYSGVVLRVRNSSRNYATSAVTFYNGDAEYLSYLDGQNYLGTKWLYGSIDDERSGPLDFRVSGTWTP